MILRRVIEHVKHQNWTAIAIDFLIVVIGVFIGIQVANWNASRQVASNDAALLQRFETELEAVEAELITTIERNQETIASTRRVLELIRSGEPPEDEAAFKNDICRSTFLDHVPALPTALQEMNTTGALTRIRQVPLRQSIAVYVQQHERYFAMITETHASMTNPANNYYQSFDLTPDAEIWIPGNPDCVQRYDLEKLQGSQGELQLWLGGQLDLDYYANTQLAEVRKILVSLKEKG